MKIVFSKIRILVAATFLLLANSSLSNAGTTYWRFGQFFYGGYLGMDFGLVNQYEISSIAGYRFTPWLHAGAGVKYQYHNDKRLLSVASSHIYGPVVFADLITIKDLNNLFSFRLIEGALFLHGELNIFSLPTEQFDKWDRHTGSNRFFQPTYLAGIGLRRHTINNRYFHVLLMLDVSGDSRVVYSNPVLRFGFMF